MLVLSVGASILVPNSSWLLQKEKSIISSIQQDLNVLESSVSSSLLDRQYFKDLIDVIHGRAPVTNEIVDKMTSFSDLAYTIYLYQEDSLLYWSKPGLIIDPQFFRGQSPPLVAGDHRSEYLIKSYSIYHNFSSYTAYAKIPLIGVDLDRGYLQIETEPWLVAESPAWQRIVTQEGDAICAIHFLKEKLGFWQQLTLLVLVLISGILFVLWLPEAVHLAFPRTEGRLGTLLPVASIIVLRGLSFAFDYHSTFDEIGLLSALNPGEGFLYSIGDLFLDSILFLVAAVLASRAPKSRIPVNANFMERNVITIGSYLIMILAIGVFAWMQRWLIMHTAFPINLEQLNFTRVHDATVLLAIASIIFGMFIFGQRILQDIPSIQPSIYRRTGSLIFAGLISVAFTSMLDLNVPLFGFYLAVLSLLLLFDLYNESKSRSVIWAISWALLIGGFEAGMLNIYQSDKDRIDRIELAHSIVDELHSKSEDVTIDDIILNVLPTLPVRYSLGIFEDNKLAYSYNHTYPLLLTDTTATSYIIDRDSRDRSEVGISSVPYTLLIGKKKSGLMQLVSLFSYVFALFNIFLFCITLANTFFQFLPKTLQLSFSSRPTLRNRIQVAIVFLIILSFVIIGFVTVFYLRNTSEDRDKKYFEDRLRAVATSITQSVEVSGVSDDPSLFVPKIASIAYVYNRQARIFDKDGSLILQSEYPGNAARAPIKMSFVQKFEIDQSGRNFSIFSQRTKRGPGYEGLLALNNNNATYGYIELPATAMIQSAPDSGMKLFGTLLNAYVFLFLIAVALAIGVANSITRPLAQLSDSLKRINLGRKNEPIDWGIDDEIGVLINDYNSMIQKLDESAQLMALTERDTAWREMAKQVAHEIKNPLTPMKLSIQYLQRGVQGDPQQLQELVKRVSNTLIEQIDNLSGIASEFSNFAKMPRAENEKVLLNDVVASVHDLFRKREDMDVQLYVPIQDIYVFADKNQIVRVLNNVLKNAIQAIPDTKRGEINITLKKQNENAIIVIDDNGTGIPPEMRDKVFRPNFTTKSSGTGLGLAISANIVQTFNGRIYFETEDGAGTRFYIEIPLMKLDDNLKEEKHVLL